ncbi:ubiquinol-cytochrome c reductase cytochrome b subunit [Actinoallomurus spadix]|uniref:Cytochrome bc1 complex cytochrome b subunit n=1 Tax=Actinoallomurus spadix TaxID=79912 RepID=A0ABP3GTS0_9ACTN|nr:ubiquinol-cytochrome c reductase cytochrome b subunit [Actinoallomurus spadix]MCO5986748.1 ubiquinol-cytochrome c reductase cytochrome b subunit [Actinoallomurus spadix]
MAGRSTLIFRAERAVDERVGSSSFLRRNVRKVFPEQWSFLLGEIALYSFVTLVLTGVFLTMFFKPSEHEVVYTGNYPQLRGTSMSEAYASTVHLSFDIRGGLLVRQIHHWAALLFVAAICVHLMRIFFTGAFRKPREINWVIGTTLFALAVAEGFGGYSLPDDLLSGTGLRIFEGILLSIPVVGTYLTFFVFGGEFPGDQFIPRLFTVHVLLIPGILIALIGAHLMLIWHQKHTQWPGPKRTERNVVGSPTFPQFLTHTLAFFLYVLGALALLGAWAQINPIWLYGPYRPDVVSSGSQPDWYVGFLEGSLRIMPRLAFSFAGHSVALNVLVPAVILPLVFFTLIGLYPFFERWVTGDDRPHHLCDRPRNVPTRTALGVAAIVWYGNLWAAGGNDVIAEVFKVRLEYTTWFFRVGFFVLPVVAFVVTRRLCLWLQRSDAEALHEGVESGTLKRLPSGEYVEVHDRPQPEKALVTRTVHPGELVRPIPDHVIPLPTPGRVLAQVRARLNHAYVHYTAEMPTPDERRELEDR